MIFRSIVTGLLLTMAAMAQDTLKCRCAPADSAAKGPDTSFVFSGGQKLALCGSITVDTREVTFSAFKIALCGSDSLVGAWDENKTCRIAVTPEKLMVQGVYNMPVGAGFSYKPVVLIVDHFWFEGAVLKRKTKVGEGLRHLNAREAAKVVQAYEAAKKPIADNPEDPLNKLFMAAVSGNKKAYQYFLGFATDNPELDNDTQIQFNELTALLRFFPMP